MDEAPLRDGGVSVVVGAHLEAEISDRPLAYALRDRLAARLGADDAVVVCTDLWYLNEKAMRLRPAITLGRAEINAAAAWLLQRVPTTILVEGRYRVHIDPELVDFDVCLWGPDARGTRDAVAAFEARWLDAYAERRAAIGC